MVVYQCHFADAPSPVRPVLACPHLDPASGGQVERLQQKLEEAHGGDYNALARAYRSLLQHIQALQIEAQAAALYNRLLVVAKAPVQFCLHTAGRHIRHKSQLSVRLVTQSRTCKYPVLLSTILVPENNAPHAYTRYQVIE